MRIKFRLVIRALFVAVLSLPICGGTAETVTPSILFALRDLTQSNVPYSDAGQKFRIVMEPIALIVDGTFKDLPRDDGKAFGAQYYPNGRQYSLLVGGKVSGQVHVNRTAYEMQCDSLAAEVAVRPEGKVAGMRMALASDWSFPASTYERRAATPTERTEIFDLAKAIYAKNGVAPDVIAKMRVDNLTAFERGDYTLFAGSFVALQPQQYNGYDYEDVNALFVIAEKSSASRPGVTYEWHHTGSENAVETQDLVDILAAEDDGAPHVITQSGYYEGDAYHVLKKINGIWREVFQQFGSGC